MARNIASAHALVRMALAAMALSLVPFSASAGGDFSCDFDESRNGVSVDGSCDGSSDGDGSFDFACDFSYDNDRTETSVSADFDGSCDALGNDRFSCDYSGSFDFDSPGRSVSDSLSCDTIGAKDSVEFRCRDAGDRPDVNEFFEQIAVTCGDPFEIPYFVLAELGDLGTVMGLLDEMQLVLDQIEDLKKTKSLQRKLVKAQKRLVKAQELDGSRPNRAQRQRDNAQRDYEKVQKLLRRVGGNLTQAEIDSLCGASLYCG